MKCHVVDNIINNHAIIHSAPDFDILCTDPRVLKVITESDLWRNEHTYNMIREKTPVAMLSDGSLVFNPPTNYINFETIQHARRFLSNNKSLIVCAMTGKEYSSVWEAAKDHQVAHRYITQSIAEGCSFFSHKLKAHSWVVNEHTPELFLRPDNRTRRILCVTTGVKYDTMTDAAVAHHLHVTAICRAIRTKRPVRGYEFRRVTR